MTDSKFRERFVSDDEPRPSHDMLETAREIQVSPEEQEDAVARERQLRVEQAARALREQAIATYEAALATRRRARRWFLIDVIAYAVGNIVLFAVNQAMAGSVWFHFPLLAWSFVLGVHSLWVFSRPKAVPPHLAPPVTSPQHDVSHRPPPPRPLAGSGREAADADERARARTTQRSTRKRD